MNTHIETRSEDLIDLGNASVETKGPAGIGNDALNQQFQPVGLFED